MTMKVGVVSSRLGDSALASHLAMTAERLKEWHDCKTELAYEQRPQELTSGTRPVDVVAASKGTG